MRISTGNKMYIMKQMLMVWVWSILKTVLHETDCDAELMFSKKNHLGWLFYASFF